jgi:hypothetical protein
VTLAGQTAGNAGRDPLRELGETVIARVGIPKDRWEIAAQLEVLGLRDADARARFGTQDLFEAADRILAMFRDGTIAFEVPADDPPRRIATVLGFVRHYLDGIMFSLPMVLQGATMLLWGYGLWGAVDLDVRTGSAIALGFIASYIATGGFAWAIVRRGLFYYYQSEGGLARWSALRMWWLSVRAAAVLAVPALLFNVVYGFLPADMFLLALAYYAALCVFWLNWALIYLVRKTHWLLVVLVISILVVVFTARILGWPIVAANLTGLAVADILTFAAGLIGLNRWARNGAGKPTVNPPRLTVLVYTTAQVFLYGFLYSLFIFTDRILAWTSPRLREDFPPYAFWLNARYEVAMDLALVVVVLLAGVVEYSTQQFSIRLVPGEKRVRGGALEPFFADFRRFYRRHTVALCIAATAAIAVAAAAVNAVRGLPYPRLQELLASETTMRVFWAAAVSYAIFMIALQSLLILMTLSRADLAARAMGAALVVNLVVGFAVSRSLHYSGAVVGLLAGSLTLAIIARRQLHRVFNELDYYYYAAY